MYYILFDIHITVEVKARSLNIPISLAALYVGFEILCVCQ